MKPEKSYELRYATRFDVDKIKTLLDSNKLTFGFIPRPAISKSIADAELIVATPINNAQNPIAFCRFHKRKDPITTVYEIFVKPEYQNQGIGKRLIKGLKPPIQAKCPAHLPSNEFYQKIGFTLTETLPGKHKELNLWIKYPT